MRIANSVLSVCFGNGREEISSRRLPDISVPAAWIANTRDANAADTNTMVSVRCAKIIQALFMGLGTATSVNVSSRWPAHEAKGVVEQHLVHISLVLESMCSLVCDLY